MKRDDLREVIARALCAADERNPDEMINATYRAWQNYCHGANAALSALDAAGMTVVPKEPTLLMIDAGWQEDVNPADVYRAMLAAKEE